LEALKSGPKSGAAAAAVVASASTPSEAAMMLGLAGTALFTKEAWSAAQRSLDGSLEALASTDCGLDRLR
jgi:hypothetical protein